MVDLNRQPVLKEMPVESSADVVVVRKTMEKLADGYLIKAEITPRRMAEVIEEMSSQPSHHHIEQASSDTAATAPKAMPRKSLLFSSIAI
jgi:TusA-related sulfurtransferase